MMLTLNNYQNENFQQQRYQLLKNHLNTVRINIEKTLSRYLGALDALEGLIKNQPNFFAQMYGAGVLESISKQVISNNPSISQIQFSPDAVISFVYPTDNANILIGTDLRKLDDEKFHIEETINSQKPLLNGPMQLMQGMKGLTFRKPVYISDDNGGTFWGFITLILDYDQLIVQFGEEINSSKYDISISSGDRQHAAEHTFFGEAKLFANDKAVNTTANVTSGTWNLAAIESNSDALTQQGKWLFWALGLGAIALITTLTWLSVMRGERLLQHATTDHLTGILNRYELLRMARIEMKRCQRYGNSLSILYMDLDHFKQINDQYGHRCGDRVLENFASSIKQMIRSSDFIGRVGGEEFCLVLPETRAEKASLLAELIRTSTEQLVHQCSRGQFSVTVSIGVAQLSSQHKRFAHLLDAADRGLYQAKHNGRNLVFVNQHTNT